MLYLDSFYAIVNALLLVGFGVLVHHFAILRKTTNNSKDGEQLAGKKNIVWSTKSWSQLTVPEIYGILKLRSEVFVVEQKCIFLDIDGGDQMAHHCFATLDNQIVAYTRLFSMDQVFTGYQAIGRVCTHPSARGLSIGKELMRRSIAECERLCGLGPIKIGAQLYLKKFYEGFGFQQAGAMYLEDEIEHIPMVRVKSAARMEKDMRGFTQFFSHPVISSVEIMQEINEKKIILIDVRSDAETGVSMIPGSVTRDEFEKRQVWQDDRLSELSIVPYCTIGYRSGKYCDELLKRGFPSRLVKNGEGIVLWTHMPGATLVTHRRDGDGTSRLEPSSKCHTFGPQWGNVGTTFEPVHFGLLEMAVHGARSYFNWNS